MRFGVVVFPGSNCEQDVVHALHHLGHDANYVWHQETNIAAFDAIVLPGGFSYGDYLRCGAAARWAPVMEAVRAYADAGRPIIGICNGFQILTEAHLLPGALLRNRGLKFICKTVPLRVEQSVCKWLDLPVGTVLRIPINHNEGNYFCDADTLANMEKNGQIVLRYCNPDGSRGKGVSGECDTGFGGSCGFGDVGEAGGAATSATSGSSFASGVAPNGALDDIAGICNERGNVLGLMPHPERATDSLGGYAGTDGATFFTAIANYANEVR